MENKELDLNQKSSATSENSIFSKKNSSRSNPPHLKAIYDLKKISAREKYRFKILSAKRKTTGTRT